MNFSYEVTVIPVCHQIIKMFLKYVKTKTVLKHNKTDKQEMKLNSKLNKKHTCITAAALAVSLSLTGSSAMAASEGLVKVKEKPQIFQIYFGFMDCLKLLIFSLKRLRKIEISKSSKLGY